MTDGRNYDLIYDHDAFTETTTIIAHDVENEQWATFCVMGKTILASGGDLAFREYVIDTLQLITPTFPIDSRE